MFGVISRHALAARLARVSFFVYDLPPGLSRESLGVFCTHWRVGESFHYLTRFRVYI